jgi:hypothetical protein
MFHFCHHSLTVAATEFFKEIRKKLLTNFEFSIYFLQQEVRMAAKKKAKKKVMKKKAKPKKKTKKAKKRKK